MRLFSGKVSIIAREICEVLTRNQEIEVTDKEEVILDIEAVLKEYLRLEREIVERVKDLLESRKLPYAQFGRLKKQVAEERGIGIGEDSIDHICTQVIGSFMHSVHVEEVFGEDHDLRRKMAIVLRKHMAVDEEVDRETREKIKNLEEGTRTWEIEYQKVMEQIKRKRGLT
jgi:hypothetical protein